jgi:cytochrome P450
LGLDVKYYGLKGSIVVANAWYVSCLYIGYLSEMFRAILHDPEVYPDPEEFKPERFLKTDGSIRDDPTLSLAFGSGKRICSGRHLVDATIFMVAASVLSAFNVTKAKDENGHEIPLKSTMTITHGIFV